MDVDYPRCLQPRAGRPCACRATARLWTANERLCEMFGASREVLIGASFPGAVPERRRVRAPRRARMAPILNAKGHYGRRTRIMKRASGEVFWCHVTGPRASIATRPHEAGIWAFEDLSAQRPVKAELTAREREVAARLLDGLTSKEIGKTLAISHRTVEIYRARLMRKYKASTTADLVHKADGRGVTGPISPRSLPAAERKRVPPPPEIRNRHWRAGRFPAALPRSHHCSARRARESSARACGRAPPAWPP